MILNSYLRKLKSFITAQRRADAFDSDLLVMLGRPRDKYIARATKSHRSLLLFDDATLKVEVSKRQNNSLQLRLSLELFQGWTLEKSC